MTSEPQPCDCSDGSVFSVASAAFLAISYEQVCRQETKSMWKAANTDGNLLLLETVCMRQLGTGVLISSQQATSNSGNTPIMDVGQEEAAQIVGSPRVWIHYENPENAVEFHGRQFTSTNSWLSGVSAGLMDYLMKHPMEMIFFCDLAGQPYA